MDKIQDIYIHMWGVVIMPRTARQRLDGAIYHVMSRSISEVQLFKTNEDKEKYLFLIKEYQYIYNFKIYAYCLMNNHVHLIMDCNGANISKIMHCINFKYARYFNTVHNRHGHLFQDRFKSKIVRDNRYLLALSAYIHNNPSDIPGYESSPEKYPYSSLAIYLGLRKDKLSVIDGNLILSLFGKGKKNSKLRYMRFVKKIEMSMIEEIAEEELEFIDEKTRYISERKILIRDFNVEDLLMFVTEKFSIERSLIHLKYNKKVMSARAVLALLLRNLCNLNCSDICRVLGNITSASVSNLCSLGVKIIYEDYRYKDIIDDFIVNYN